MENVPSDMYSKQRLRQPTYPHSLISLHLWLPKMCPVMILIRLRICAGWSESSLGAHARRYVFWRSGFHMHLFMCVDFRVSVRRPLNTEPEEHIYAEIEPLQVSCPRGTCIATDRALFSSEKCWYLSYFSTKTYVHRGTSNEYPQHIFSWRNKKNIMWIPPLICIYAGLTENAVPTLSNPGKTFSRRHFEIFFLF